MQKCNFTRSSTFRSNLLFNASNEINNRSSRSQRTIKFSWPLLVVLTQFVAREPTLLIRRCRVNGPAESGGGPAFHEMHAEYDASVTSGGSHDSHIRRERVNALCLYVTLSKTQIKRSVRRSLTGKMLFNTSRGSLHFDSAERRADGQVPRGLGLVSVTKSFQSVRPVLWSSGRTLYGVFNELNDSVLESDSNFLIVLKCTYYNINPAVVSL